jgi:hypothetical protein
MAVPALEVGFFNCVEKTGITVALAVGNDPNLPTSEIVTRLTLIAKSLAGPNEDNREKVVAIVCALRNRSQYRSADWNWDNYPNGELPNVFPISHCSRREN